MFFRFILVNVFSFIKRFFSFKAILYKVVVFIPLLTVITPRISRKSLIFVIIFSFILILTGNIEIYVYYIMYFLLLLAIPMFKKVSFEILLSRLIIFFLIVSFYGISQKYFGYSFVEMNWLRSGLSFADEKAFFIRDIRPFSTFASMPEFTLFISVFLYFFTIKHKYSLIIFSFIMLYIAGSRGVIISTLIAFFFTFIFKKYTNKYLLFSFFTSLSVFIFLIFIYPYISNYIVSNSRMFVYGTFNWRIELLNRILEKSSLLSMITGIKGASFNSRVTYDNLYLMLITNFGIFGGIYFLFFFIRQNLDKKKFYFLSIFLGYGFYADMVNSYYLMFLFFFAIYSNSNQLIEPKASDNIHKKLALNKNIGQIGN